MDLRFRWMHLITPLIYLGFGILALFSIFTFVVIFDSIGLLVFNGWLELPMLLLVVGSLEGWYATKLMCFIDGLQRPRLQDHLRQSLLVYIVAGWLLYQTVLLPYYGGLGEAYRLMTTMIALYWIVINAVSILLLRIDRPR